MRMKPRGLNSVQKLAKVLKLTFAMLGLFLAGAIFTLLTGNNALALAQFSSVFAFVVSVFASVAFILVGIIFFALILQYLAKPSKEIFVIILKSTIAGILSLQIAVTRFISSSRSFSVVILKAINTRILSFKIAITRFFSSSHSFIKKDGKSRINQPAWDVGVIVDFTQKLTDVFPEDWNKWEHEIRDIMDSRTSMQSKGINHHLVSLITFYRFTRFMFHIGIDKVYILATRRATR